MTLRLAGSTSGYTEIDAPAVAGSNTILLPAGNGSANQFLKNGSTAGSLGWSSATEDSSGNFAFNSGYGSAATAYGCRAWVNFNGTTASPSTIRGSGNVSSVTKNGTGDYTVNFTTAMVDANYSWSYSCQYLNSGSWVRENIFPMMADGANQVLAGSLRFNTATTSALYDSAIITVAIFR